MKEATELRREAAELERQARELEQQAAYVAAYDSLLQIGRAEFEVRESLDFPDYLKPLFEAVEAAQREIAIKLGHERRVETLVVCGMDRERANIGDMTTDEDAAHSLATWLFDLYGPYYASSSVLWDVKLNGCPMGVQFYKDGNHDT